jgi:DNA repair exonuclease SbcCD ATPase subunit
MANEKMRAVHAQIAQDQREAARRAINTLHKESEAEALAAINVSCSVLRKIADHLDNLDYGNMDACKVCGRKGITPEAASKAAANLTKVVSDIGRFVHFDRGEADSRAEVKGLDELLKVLTKDQFDQVWKWVEEGQRAPDVVQ